MQLPVLSVIGILSLSKFLLPRRHLGCNICFKFKVGYRENVTS